MATVTSMAAASAAEPELLREAEPSKSAHPEHKPQRNRANLNTALDTQGEPYVVRNTSIKKEAPTPELK